MFPGRHICEEMNPRQEQSREHERDGFALVAMPPHVRRIEAENQIPVAKHYGNPATSHQK